MFVYNSLKKTYTYFMQKYKKTNTVEKKECFFCNKNKKNKQFSLFALFTVNYKIIFKPAKHDFFKKKRKKENNLPIYCILRQLFLIQRQEIFQIIQLSSVSLSRASDSMVARFKTSRQHSHTVVFFL